MLCVGVTEKYVFQCLNSNTSGTRKKCWFSYVNSSNAGNRIVLRKSDNIEKIHLPENPLEETRKKRCCFYVNFRNRRNKQREWIILYANALIRVNQREMFQNFCEALQYKKSNMIDEEQKYTEKNNFRFLNQKESLLKLH